MSIRNEARQEAERRYPIRLPYNRDFEIRYREQKAFEDGAVWASEQADRGCGHPNHGAEDHDCAPFLPDREPSDAAVEAAGEAIWGRGWRVPKEVVRAALLAAQEVRNRG